MVEDGLLRTEGGMGLLWYSREKLGNCVIRVVYKTANERANSGVYIRIADRPRTRGTPSITVSKCRSWTRAARVAAPARSTRSRRQPPSRPKPGEWNTMEITLKGNRVVTKINGVQVTEFDSSELKPESTEKTGEGDPARGPRPESGYIGPAEPRRKVDRLLQGRIGSATRVRLQ